MFNPFKKIIITKKRLIERFKKEYYRDSCSWEKFIPKDGQVYRTDGDFLNWGCNYTWFFQSDYMMYDERGSIMYKNGNTYIYNPVTTAEWALTVYGQWLRKEKDKDDFLKIAGFLLEMEESDGSFRYYYDFPYYLNKKEYMKSGWVSGMAEGHALSVFARAYNLTMDQKWIVAADKILDFLDVPLLSGGVKTSLGLLDCSLKENYILEEYPCNPPSYTLNGFMYAIIGLFDWASTDTSSSKRAKNSFDDYIQSLKLILPYYDYDGASSYDLGHITWGRRFPKLSATYHSIHIAFCQIFYTLTGEAVFLEYFNRWKDSIG